MKDIFIFVENILLPEFKYTRITLLCEQNMFYSVLDNYVDTIK